MHDGLSAAYFVYGDRDAKSQRLPSGRTKRPRSQMYRLRDLRGHLPDVCITVYREAHATAKQEVHP